MLGSAQATLEHSRNTSGHGAVVVGPKTHASEAPFGSQYDALIHSAPQTLQAAHLDYCSQRSTKSLSAPFSSIDKSTLGLWYWGEGPRMY